MDFGEGSYEANLFNDEISNLSNEIHEFCRITSQPKFRYTQILDQLMSFKASNILKYLMDQPTLASAQTCLQMYLQSNPDLPSIFLNRFLCVVSADVQLTRYKNGSVGSLENSSLRANIIVNNVMPTKTITAGTSTSRIANIRQEIKDNSELWSVPPVRMAQPYKIKIDMNDDFIQTLVREQSNLSKTIQEANRCNGFEADSFISTKIIYS